MQGFFSGILWTKGCVMRHVLAPEAFFYLFPASWANLTGKHKNMNGQEENYRNRNDFMHSKNNWSFVKNQPKRPRQKRYKNQYKDNAPSCVHLSPVQTGMYQTEQKKQHRC